MSLSGLIDRVIAEAAAGKDDLGAAREDWDARSGRVLYDDPLYEARSTAFLEWYALERRDAGGQAPIDRLIAGLTVGDPDEAALRLLSHTHRSLFRIHEVRGQHVELDDLLTGCRFRVFERRQPLGLGEGDLFEARLCARLELTGEVVLTRAIQHHPREAGIAIEDIAERSRALAEPRDEVLFRLAKLRLKAARWGHVSPERIYRGEDAAE